MYLEGSGPFDPLKRRVRKPTASREQFITVVAEFAVAFTATAGLTIDLGGAFAQLRTVRGAAEAKAPAGVRVEGERSTSKATLARAVNHPRMDGPVPI